MKKMYNYCSTSRVLTCRGINELDEIKKMMVAEMSNVVMLHVSKGFTDFKFVFEELDVPTYLKEQGAILNLKLTCTIFEQGE